MNLELGCGHRFGEAGPRTPDTIGLDVIPPASVVADLRSPLPFADNTFETVWAEQVLEHVRAEYTYAVWDEVWRVLVPGGEFEGSVPGVDLAPEMAYRDPTHVSFYTKGTFFYLTASFDHELGREGFHAGRRAVWDDHMMEIVPPYPSWAYHFRFRAVK